MAKRSDPLTRLHAPVRDWFRSSFARPTTAQRRGWASILDGRSTLLLAPTGSGKTLAAFLVALDRLMFSAPPDPGRRLRVLYVSPLKALAVDVERNLRAPLAGIAARCDREGIEVTRPVVALRHGDTPQDERRRMRRTPPDILITTPESLFLLLTSGAREMLSSVETVIVDEIHSIAGSKRGAHLAVSLERLERIVAGADTTDATDAADARPLQRIGLSATQRPLDEVARFLGGGRVSPSGAWSPRDVAVVDAGRRKEIDLTIEVPVEDMARLGEPAGEIASGPAAAGPPTRSIWPSIHPRLVALIREHRSTMVFVNSRRLAERLAAALNEEAGEEIALAHHGSIARETRVAIEDRLKRGDLPAIIATSSMELGVDMGAVDLVVQIEAPPSVASGLQRIGRANHSVGETPRGVVFPKYRGDLLACAAVASSMDEGRVEETRYPRHPLDVLAQQVVAMVAMEPLGVETILETVRRAAPFAELPESAFESVLDMLSGRYPSDRFRELRARVTWDRVSGRVEGRRGARALAVANAGTIPDRGLYGVFLPGEEGGPSRRVGELDEEMVFETHAGDVFLLGASSWRVDSITHDRVIVTPAPGEPGKMPFWHGDRPGRSLELGRAIGQLARELVGAPREEAEERLRSRHGLDERAARNLLAYLGEQREATGHVPTDRTIVVERYLDEVGDWRLCVLSPFGAAVHAPWATAAAGRLEEATGLDVESLWSDDGMVFRLPETGEPPDVDSLLLDPDEAESLVTRRLGTTALFAARFRESAGRALLLPRRRPGRRHPLWVQRRRSADLLEVAADYPSFPLLLETYRECLRDVFDLPGLVDLLRSIRERRLRVVTVESRQPSPFASSLLFSYVANFIYEGDAPLAERRARVLAIDHAQLRELLGDAELRELLDPAVVDEVEASLQRLDGERPVRDPDDVHDLLLAIGDLSEREIRRRAVRDAPVAEWLSALERGRRTISLRVRTSVRRAAAEDAARYRDGLGVALPRGLPDALLEPVADPLGDLVSRFARTHGPFASRAAAARLGIGRAAVEGVLRRLEAEGRVVRGAFLREGEGEEWCDAEVLRILKRRSLARLRAEVEPVAPAALSRLVLDWQGLTRPGRGVDGLLAAIEQLQGCPIVASTLESEVLPARVEEYEPGMLDELCASGEVIWRGVGSLGPADGRLALYLRDRYPLLAPAEGPVTGDLATALLELLGARGASFFASIAGETGAFRGDLLDALWDLVWAGRVTNDTLAPLRSRLRAADPEARRRGRRRRAARTSRLGPPGSEGRWSLLPDPGAGGGADAPGETERRTALTTLLLERYGVLTREAVHAEGLRGGFAAVYDVLKAMEEAGRIRRGYFVAALGATQFAAGGADDRLRALREPSEEPTTLVLAATDPASIYGTIAPWPERDDPRPERRAGARVILHDGELVAWIARGGKSLVTFLPSDEPARGEAVDAIVRVLSEPVERGELRASLIARIDGETPDASPLAPALEAAGFRPGGAGWLLRGAAGEPRGRRGGRW